MRANEAGTAPSGGCRADPNRLAPLPCHSRTHDVTARQACAPHMPPVRRMDRRTPADLAQTSEETGFRVGRGWLRSVRLVPPWPAPKSMAPPDASRPAQFHHAGEGFHRPERLSGPQPGQRARRGWPCAVAVLNRRSDQPRRTVVQALGDVGVAAAVRRTGGPEQGQSWQLGLPAMTYAPRDCRPMAQLPRIHPGAH
jgi:hypothetical protein